MDKNPKDRLSGNRDNRRAFLKTASVVAGASLVPGMSAASVDTSQNKKPPNSGGNGYTEFTNFTTAEVNGETVAIKLAVSAPPNPDSSGGTTKELGLAWMTSSEEGLAFNTSTNDGTFNHVFVRDVKLRPQNGQDLGISPLRAYLKGTTDSGGYENEALEWVFQAVVSAGAWYAGVPALPVPTGLDDRGQQDSPYGEDSWSYDTSIHDLQIDGGTNLAVSFGTESADGASGKSYPLELVAKGELMKQVDHGDRGIIVGKGQEATGEFIECTVPFTVEFS